MAPVLSKTGGSVVRTTSKTNVCGGSTTIHAFELDRASAPIDRLPDEILSIIFAFAVTSFKPNLNSSPLSVSHVSTRWRTVAINSSELWTCFYFIFDMQPDFDSPLTPVFEVWLERSRKRPLTVFMAARRLRGRSVQLDPKIFGLIFSDASRLTELHLHPFPRRFFQPGFLCPAGSCRRYPITLPNLEILYIYSGRDRKGADIFMDAFIAPNLKDIDITGLGTFPSKAFHALVERSSCDLHKLYFDLWSAPPRLRNCLKAVPKLKDLSITYGCLMNTETIAALTPQGDFRSEDQSGSCLVQNLVTLKLNAEMTLHEQVQFATMIEARLSRSYPLQTLLIEGEPIAEVRPYEFSEDDDDNGTPLDSETTDTLSGSDEQETEDSGEEEEEGQTVHDSNLVDQDESGGGSDAGPATHSSESGVGRIQGANESDREPRQDSDFWEGSSVPEDNEFDDANGGYDLDVGSDDEDEDLYNPYNSNAF